jgi:hypothetical protein
MFALGKSRGAVLALLFVIAAVASCSEKITSVDERRIDLEIWTSVAGSGQAAQASAFRLTVTGPGIVSPIVAKLTLSDGVLTGSVVVSAGPDRVFRIDAYDEAGTLIYSGQTVADVVSGSELRLDIDLVPRVPMITVSPLYLETLQGDLLAMKVRVYNLPDVAGIEINFVDHRQVGNTYIGPTSVVVDPQIAKVADYSVTTEADYSTTVRFELRSTSDRIVDRNGYAELVTFYYQTRSYEVSPFETATFTPAVLFMRDKLGGELPLAQIRTEPSVALLYSYNARHIAFWNMDYGDIFSIVQDQSANGLDGTATGTAIAAGARGGFARSFNGIGDFVEVPDDALLDVDDEITISMWVSLAGYGLNPHSSLICKRTKDGPINYQLMLEDPSSADGSLAILFRYGGPVYHVYRVEIADSWRTQGWFHVLFSYRFGEPASALLVLGYGCTITGMPGTWVAGNGRAPAPNTSGALFMGKDNASTTGYFAGSLDELELFDIAWTQGLAQYYFFTGCR